MVWDRNGNSGIGQPFLHNYVTALSPYFQKSVSFKYLADVLTRQIFKFRQLLPLTGR